MSFPERIGVSARTALVAGAAAGIGRASALALAAHGAAAVVLLDLNEEGAQAVAEEVRALGANAVAYGVDAGDFAAVSELVADVDERAGPVELLVNAAGNIAATPFLELTPAEWEATLVSHVKSVYTTCRLFAPGMAERGYGRIVNIASIAGKRGGGFLGKTAYASAKAAVNGLTKALARELAPYGVRVNAVNPGMTDTRRLDLLRADPAVWARCLAMVPLGRIADPMEIAAAVLYLLSDASSYVTGETLNVDGGVAME